MDDIVDPNGGGIPYNAHGVMPRMGCHCAFSIDRSRKMSAVSNVIKSRSSTSGLDPTANLDECEIPPIRQIVGECLEMSSEE